MAEERDNSAEQELLRLIEGDSAKDGPAEARAKPKKAGIFSPEILKSKLAFLKDGFGKHFTMEGLSQLVDIKALNKVLIVSICGLTIYLFYSLYTSITHIRTLPNLKFEIPSKAKSTASPEVTALKAASYYLVKVRGRDIFKMGREELFEEEEEDAFDMPDEGPSNTIVEATQHLRLVGISWSDDPDAMIEDTDARRTFFVKRGQLIGDVKVEAIFKEKIVLSLEGEEIELQ